jgi:glyoxylase-like metal-dependent hydrolase (beta-lactamase superfamily II)
VPLAQIDLISHGLWVWQHYDPALKTDLFSSAIQTRSGLYLVDPIPLPDDALRSLSGSAPIAGIIITNANHHRASLEYSNRLSIPIFAHQNAFPASKPSRLNEVGDGDTIGGEIEVTGIHGAGVGEVALYQSENGGSLIVGDALINFEPCGFTFLPRKYCENEKQMRVSLRKLLRPAERMLFAHGTPIASSASERLRQLLNPE